MSTSRLLEDANLSDVVLRNGTTGVEFLFLNMSDGGEIGTLRCNGVVLFTYCTVPDEGLPHYVGEVNHSVLRRGQAQAFLAGCGRFNPDAVVQYDNEQLHHVEMAGSMSITVLCSSVEFQRAGQ
jgi:hypothetical protein